MSSFAPLYRESLGDAMRRRITPVIVAMCLFSAMMLDGCTACATGEVMVNGEPTTITELAGGAGLVTMVVLGLWILVLAALLASDHLSQTLEDGSANLCLARPVSRSTYVLARLAGSLTLAGAAGFVLLGFTVTLLTLRAGLSPIPAFWTLVACGAGCITVGALSMAASLVLPRLGTAIVALAGIGAVAMANALEGFRQTGAGWLGLLDQLGPPLASSMALTLAPWVPGANIPGDPVMLTLRALAWCAISISILEWTFKRTELGR